MQNSTRPVMPLKQYLVTVIAAVCMLPLSASAVGFTKIYNSASFSWLDQYSLTNAINGNIASQACVPTSSVNALTYLQNSSLAYFGTNLTGTDYASWTQAGYTLSAPDYLNTMPGEKGGTMLDHLPYALNKYITTTKGFSNVVFSGMVATNNGWTDPFNKPEYILAENPTTTFLTNALFLNQAILFSNEYAAGGGHEMTAGGLEWNDLNNNGIMDKTDGAKLFILDPLDPSINYSPAVPTGSAKYTEGHIWYDSGTSKLMLDYPQYTGGLPYVSGSSPVTNSFIDAIITIAVPEPSTYALLVLSGAGFAYVLRRRASKQVSRLR